jgi:hypothetical protein
MWLTGGVFPPRLLVFVTELLIEQRIARAALALTDATDVVGDDGVMDGRDKQTGLSR